MIHDAFDAYTGKEWPTAKIVCMYKNIPQLRILPNLYCGRKCFYCRSSGEGVVPTGKRLELRPDDFVAVAAAYAGLGGREIKVSGGDPALSTKLVSVVERTREGDRKRGV